MVGYKLEGGGLGGGDGGIGGKGGMGGEGGISGCGGGEVGHGVPYTSQQKVLRGRSGVVT